MPKTILTVFLRHGVCVVAVERRKHYSGKSQMVDMQQSAQNESTCAGTTCFWAPSQACGLSTPPPPHLESKPAPLILSPMKAGVSEDSKSAPLPLSSSGAHDDFSMPSTPLTDPVTSRRYATAFEVTLNASRCILKT